MLKAIFRIITLILIVALIATVITVWIILEPGRGCQNNVTYHLGYVGLALNPIRKSITVKNKHGKFIGVTKDSELLKALFLNNGVYEPQITDMITNTLKKNDVFIDVGAKEGYFSIVASRCVTPTGQVYSFEGNLELLSKLHDFIKINEIQNITVLPFSPARIVTKTRETHHQQQKQQQQQLLQRPNTHFATGLPVLERNWHKLPRAMQKFVLSKPVIQSSTVLQDLIQSNQNIRHNNQVNTKKQRNVLIHINLPILNSLFCSKHNTSEDVSIDSENDDDDDDDDDDDASDDNNDDDSDYNNSNMDTKEVDENEIMSAVMNLESFLMKPTEYKSVSWIICMVPKRNQKVIELLESNSFRAEMIDVKKHIYANNDWTKLKKNSNTLKYTFWKIPK